VACSVIVKAEAPFLVLHVNEQWTAMRGQSQPEVEGRPLDLMQVSASTMLLYQAYLLNIASRRCDRLCSSRLTSFNVRVNL
jgi:hypothetical protein